MKRRVQKHHFSLIELLTVCGILLILAGIGVGVYSLVHRKMQDSRCQAMIAKMCVALENYKNKTGYYIQAVSATALYIDNYGTAANQPNLNNFIDIPQGEIGNNAGAPWSRGAWKDPWGNEFRYQCPGSHNRMTFDLYSRGEDKFIDTADDITNWKQ